MITQLLISGVIGLIGWFVLMYLSTNLLGMFVRGLFTNPELGYTKLIKSKWYAKRAM